MSEKTKKKKHGKVRWLLFFAAVLLLAAGSAVFLRSGNTSSPPENGVADRSPFLSLFDRFTMPQELRELAEKNPDAAEFVAKYSSLKDKDYIASNIVLTTDYTVDTLPHLTQWDLRWGYAQYGDGWLGLTGCGPTCLSMVTVGLTGNAEANPLAVANYSDSQGWYVDGVGTSWELMRSGAEHFGLSWQELPLDESVMRQALDAGGVLILSMLPGDFTESGHFIVVSGCSEEGFTVLDPNSYSRSRDWSYAELCTQIGNIWAYSV